MTTPSNLDPGQRISQLYWGFAISRAIHVAARLGIADHVQTNGTSTNTIADALGLNEDRLYRLMRLLASYDIFNETEKRIFIPTPLSETIRTDSENSLRDASHLVTKSMWEAYGHLEHSIRTGEDSYTDLFGKGVFEHLDDHKDESEEFDNAMHNYAELENPAIASVLQLSNITTIIDVGGGQGGFLKQVLLANPAVKGILFDQPHVIHDAILPGDDPAIADRVMKVGGNFFEFVPGNADAYILKRILHDWSDDDCARILQACVKAMPPQARIFVIDAIVPAGNVPHFSKDLEAFLMTWGGQERDREEFDALFDRVGLKTASVTETPSLLSIVEAVRK